MIDRSEQTQIDAALALETVFDNMGAVYQFIMQHTPHSTERDAALNTLTDTLSQSRALRGMVEEAGAQIEGFKAMVITANHQLEQALRDYYQLEEAVDLGDETHELVAALIQRTREDDDVVASEDVWKIVGKALANTFAANARLGVEMPQVTDAQVRSFLESVRYDELPPDAAAYLAQLIAYAQQSA